MEGGEHGHLVLRSKSGTAKQVHFQTNYEQLQPHHEFARMVRPNHAAPAKGGTVQRPLHRPGLTLPTTRRNKETDLNMITNVNFSGMATNSIMLN